MSSFRLEMRQRAVQAIVAANTPAGAAVYPSRVDPADAARLPMITVTTGSERAASENQVNVEFRSVLTLEIRCHASGTTIEDVEAEIEAMIHEVRAALFNSQDFVAAPVLHIDAQNADPEYGAGERYVGAALMQIDVAYRDVYTAQPGGLAPEIM